MSKAYARFAERNENHAELGWLAAFDAALAKCERFAASTLLAGLFVLIVVNVALRFMGSPLIWADEVAIYAMAWVALLGASAALAEKGHVAITLLTDRLPRAAALHAARTVDAVLLIVLVSLLWMLWRWFDPVNFLLAEDAQTYALTSFNFMHQEPTQTVGMAKIWFWLALPIFALGATIHVAVRLVQSLEVAR